MEIFLENFKFLTDHKGLVLSTQGVQNFPEITLSLVVLKINDIFHFQQDGGRNMKNSQIFRGHKGLVINLVLSTLSGV